MILRTESGPLYFQITGEGPPLVFVSGWAMSSNCWQPAIEALERKCLCLAYDQRGIARSQPANQRARFTIEDHAEDLHQILERAGIFDATIIGHETGALVAAACIRLHPQDARALVIVSPRATVTESDVKQLAVFTPASLALRELAAYPLIRNIVARRFSRAPQPYRNALFEDFANLDPRAAYETALSASSQESSASLERIITRASLPVLLICGEKDKKGATEARRLFSLARAAKLATMRGCGFLPMLEYPQQFVRLLDRFVSAQATARRSLSRSKP
ncbi:MAG TPA: alpha/beta hydrolase [Blastocatellia bacterium]|nr:alpha/beta hydrolase [Blastocatellia bacterium]